MHHTYKVYLHMYTNGLYTSAAQGWDTHTPWQKQRSHQSTPPAPMRSLGPAAERHLQSSQPHAALSSRPTAARIPGTALQPQRAHTKGPGGAGSPPRELRHPPGLCRARRRAVGRRGCGTRRYGRVGAEKRRLREPAWLPTAQRRWRWGRGRPLLPRTAPRSAGGVGLDTRADLCSVERRRSGAERCGAVGAAGRAPERRGCGMRQRARRGGPHSSPPSRATPPAVPSEVSRRVRPALPGLRPPPGPAPPRPSPHRPEPLSPPRPDGGGPAALPPPDRSDTAALSRGRPAPLRAAQSAQSRREAAQRGPPARDPDPTGPPPSARSAAPRRPPALRRPARPPLAANPLLAARAALTAGGARRDEAARSASLSPAGPAGGGGGGGRTAALLGPPPLGQ